MSQKTKTNVGAASPAPHGSAAGVTTPKGRCIVCGSGLLLQYWRGHTGNQRIHCNDCGSEVTPLMHTKKQPNADFRHPPQ